MSKKNLHKILMILGVIIMLSAFLIVTDSKPWYYEVLLFDVGFILSIIPKFPKIKKKFTKIKANL